MINIENINQDTKNLPKTIEKWKRDKRVKEGKSCVYCGCSNPLLMTVDHRIPKIRGGQDDVKNLQPVCFFCNNIKGGLTHEEFLEYYKTLKILHKLQKVKVEFPKDISLIFSAHYFPGGIPIKQNYPRSNQTIPQNTQQTQTPITNQK